MMYNNNIYFSLIREYIMTKTFLLYETMYNNNIYFSLIREYIMTTNISVIQDNVFLIIRNDV